MEERVCKKCKKVMPTGYKHKKCEACINKSVSSAKKGAKVLGGIAGLVAIIGTFINNKSKA